jgi:hypothetical protein
MGPISCSTQRALHAHLDALKKNVLLAVRDLIREDVRSGVIDLRFRIDAEDRDGAIVYALGFAKALNIVPEDGPPGDEHTS